MLSFNLVANLTVERYFVLIKEKLDKIVKHLSNVYTCYALDNSSDSTALIKIRDK